MKTYAANQQVEDQLDALIQRGVAFSIGILIGQVRTESSQGSPCAGATLLLCASALRACSPHAHRALCILGSPSYSNFKPLHR